eukprot:303858_1
MPEPSAHPGIVTLGKSSENNFKPGHLNNEYHDDQENQIPALQSIPKSTHNTNHIINDKQIDLTKEQSLESSTSSTSHYLQDIEKSHESELCQIHNDDNQQICLLESNHLHHLTDIYETSFMFPANIRFLAWNWWNMNADLIKYYKNDVTFHGPNLYLSGPSTTSPYPQLRASNFDTIDFEYPLKYIVCRLPEHGHNLRLMTDIVSESIQEDINNHIGSSAHSHHNHIGSDEELEKDIESLNIKWSVSGTFIAKPYNEDVYDADGSFDIHLHCNWNIDCIESDCQYNVYILPSHAQNRTRSKEINVFEQDYHSLDMNSQERINGTLRIYPEQNNDNKSTRNTRKRCRSQMDEEQVSNHSTSNHNGATKRRRLNDENATTLVMNGGEHDEKHEMEQKSNEHKPLQKRLKHKSSNRKSQFTNKTEQRYGRHVAVTVDRKPKRKQNHNHKNEETKMNPNARYRGYFIALFLPRSSELYPFCTESMNLQPFIRGQIVFYDAIHADQAKPNKENYEWLIANMIRTYRKKGKNLPEFMRMRRETEMYHKQLEYEEQRQILLQRHQMNHNHNHRTRSGSIVFDVAS